MGTFDIYVTNNCFPYNDWFSTQWNNVRRFGSWFEGFDRFGRKFISSTKAPSRPFGEKEESKKKNETGGKGYLDVCLYSMPDLVQ